MEIIAQAKATLGWIGAGLFGRLVWLGGEIRAGRRRFWSADMLVELPVAIGMGYLGSAFAGWLGQPELAIAFAGAGGYFGTHALDVVFSKFTGKI